MNALVDKYRPSTFNDVVGNDGKVNVLRKFCAAPTSTAFMICGPSGVGKTSLAHIVARTLNPTAFNGLGMIEIASGELTGAAVSEVWNRLAYSPGGTGWTTLICNESDTLTQGAAVKLLDCLERLPKQTVIIFTSNDISNMPDRLLSRMKVLMFSAQGLAEPAGAWIEFVAKQEGVIVNGLKLARVAKNNLRTMLQELEIQIMEEVDNEDN